MANNHKFKVKNGLQTQNISFVDSSGTDTITASMLGTDTLSFSGSAGQLFSLTDSLSGTIFSVNDVSGIPSIEVDDDGTIRFAEFSGNILLGTDTDDGTSKLQVDGNISFSADLKTGSTTVIDSNRVLTNLDGAIKSDSNFAFLTVADSAQNIRTKSVFAGTSYGDTPPAGSFNATNTYELNGTTVIDSTRQIFAKTGTQVGEDGTYAGYGVIGFGGVTNGYNRVFGRDDNGDGLFLAAASNRGVIIRTNGSSADTFGFTAAGAFQVAGTTVLDSSRNLTAGTISASSISSGNITTTGYLRGPASFVIDPAAHGNDTGTVVIAGNLQIDGTTTTINSTTVTLDDKNIVLASGSTNKAAANGAGFTVDCGSDADATLTYLSATDNFQSNKEFSVLVGSSQISFDEYSNGATIWLDGSNGDFVGGDYFGLHAYGTTDFAFSYGATTKMTLKNNGNLGIGTSNPLDLLHINSASGDARQVIDAHTGFDAELKYAVNGTVKYTTGYDAATDSFVIGTSNVDTGKRVVINNAGKVLVNGAHDNGGKADFAVDGGMQISLYDGQVQAGGSDMSWNSKFFYDGHTKLGGWDNNVHLFSQAGSTGTAKSIIFSPQAAGGASTETMRVIGGLGATIGDLSVANTKLQINQSGVASGIHIARNDQTSTNFATTRNRIIFGDEIIGSGIRHQASVTAVREAWSSSPTALTFETSATVNAATEKMRITSAGNVGIGAERPTSHINTGGVFKPDSNGKFLTVNGGAHGSFIMLESQTTTDNDQIGGIYWNRTGGQGDAHKQVAGIDVIQDAYAPTNTLEGGTLRFFTKQSGSGVNTPRMVIAGTGNVGIGTESPSNLLHVHATGNNSAALIIEDDVRRLEMGRDQIQSKNAAGTSVENLYIQPSGTTVFASNSGNVGIGENSPGSKLHVKDATNISASSGGAGQFRIEGNGYTTSIAMDATRAHIYHNSSLRNLSFGTNESIDMTIKASNGHVGIGTEAPERALHVVGGIHLPNNNIISWDQADGTLRNAIYVDSGDDMIIGDTNFDDIYFSTGQKPKTVVIKQTTGNVGIGTQSPAAKLHVTNGSVGGTLNDEIIHAEISGNRHHLDFKEVRTATSNDWNSTTYRLQNRVDSSKMSSIDFVADASYNRHIDINTASNTFNTRFTHNGRVGINTTSPGEKLDVNGSVKIREVGAGNGLLLHTNSGVTLNNNLFQLWSSQTSGFSFHANSTGDGSSEKVRITAAGSVGIGTSSPDTLLEVVGADPILTIRDTETSGGSTNATLRLAETGASDTLNNYWDINHTGGSALAFKSLIGITANEAMRIDASGNLGIGVTNPSAYYAESLVIGAADEGGICLLYTSPSPRD